MAKRAVDLSLADLATMGARAAQRAARKAHEAGLMITGTAGRLEDESSVPSVNWRLTPGIVAGPETRSSKDGGSKKSKTLKTTALRGSSD